MYSITTFYKFTEVSRSELELLRHTLTSHCTDSDIKGLILVGVEGINATVSGSQLAITHFKNFLASKPYFGQLLYKDSTAAIQPFRRLAVQIREEIVTFGKPDLVPTTGSTTQRHLSPAAWQKVLEQEDVILLDTRNNYETALGTFKGALDPNITEFGQFPGYVEKAALPKDKKILMYCTGGIRCEKAILELQAQGYVNVFQLEGGILNYLEQYPNKNFEGECFVFDKRVAVDQELAASTKYKLCPHCGNPGAIRINCAKCDKEAVLCQNCKAVPVRNTCSKNCAYHYGGYPAAS